MNQKIAQRLAAAVLTVSLLSGGTAVAAADDPAPRRDATLIYGGDNKIVVTPTDLNLFQEGMMPGGESSQKLWLRNDYGASVNVYVRAESAGDETSGFPLELQKSLLEKLKMTVSVRVGTGQSLVRYDGAASGVVGAAGSLTPSADAPYGLLLGRLSSGGAADMTVTVSAPQSLGNEYQNAAAKVRWVFTCDADKKSGGGGGGGGGNPGGGSGVIVDPTVSIPEESIPDSDVPLDPGNPAGSVSSGGSGGGSGEEIIPGEEIPLIDAPGTGPKTGDENNAPLVAALFVLSGLCAALLFRLHRRENK